eukprot:7017930-Pyramimonas_sp.AAC.1
MSEYIHLSRVGSGPPLDAFAFFFLTWSRCARCARRCKASPCGLGPTTWAPALPATWWTRRVQEVSSATTSHL